MKESECEKCKELNENWGNEEYKAICWNCHDGHIDEYEKKEEKSEVKETNKI